MIPLMQEMMSRVNSKRFYVLLAAGYAIQQTDGVDPNIKAGLLAVLALVGVASFTLKADKEDSPTYQPPAVAPEPAGAATEPPK